MSNFTKRIHSATDPKPTPPKPTGGDKPAPDDGGYDLDMQPSDPKDTGASSRTGGRGR